MNWDSIIEADKQLLLSLNGSNSLFADGMAMVLTTAQTWIPLYLAIIYIVIKNNENIRQIMLVISCTLLCVLLAGGLDDILVKPLVARWRPTHDPQIGMLVDVVNQYRGGNYGYFSAHAANTFSIALFISLVVRNKSFTLSLVAWSLTNCWTRVYLGVHYPGDILCGLLWGAVVAIIVYFLLYRKIYVRLTSGMRFISSQYTSSGYLVSDVNVVLCTIMFTVLYACIRTCIILE